MKVLIYGAGVIGSLYAVLFSGAGVDVELYARGSRLEFLRQNGLLYKKDGKTQTADVRVLASVPAEKRYDFIFLTVRENQMRTALRELERQSSPTIVTMVNTLTPYTELERFCGQGRILPAFPGAGGGLADGVLDAALTPRLIQPTTFGEIGGTKTERAKRLAKLFRQSGIPYQIVSDMYAWQLSHLGMVVPLADAYYAVTSPEKVWQDRAVMRRTALTVRENFRRLARQGKLSPGKFYFILPLPVWLLAWILREVYRSSFGERFMYRHAMKAPDEMAELHREFYGYLRRNP